MCILKTYPVGLPWQKLHQKLPGCLCSFQLFHIKFSPIVFIHWYTTCFSKPSISSEAFVFVGVMSLLLSTEVGCSGLPSLQYGSWGTPTTNVYGGQVQGTCNEGYIVPSTGNTIQQIHCQADGTWSQAEDCTLSSMFCANIEPPNKINMCALWTKVRLNF